jgi:hypothetical protein
MIPQPFVRRTFTPVNRNRKRHTRTRLAIIHTAPWLVCLTVAFAFWAWIFSLFF